MLLQTLSKKIILHRINYNNYYMSSLNTKLFSLMKIQQYNFARKRPTIPSGIGNMNGN